MQVSDLQIITTHAQYREAYNVIYSDIIFLGDVKPAHRKQLIEHTAAFVYMKATFVPFVLRGTPEWVWQELNRGFALDMPVKPNLNYVNKFRIEELIALERFHEIPHGTQFDVIDKIAVPPPDFFILNHIEKYLLSLKDKK